MAYDFSFLWGWLLAALVVGLIVGWMTHAAGMQGRWFFGWYRIALIGMAIGLIIAWLHIFPGRLGYWLETALWFLASYLVGCLIGGFLKSMFAPQIAAAPVALAAAKIAPAAPAAAVQPKPAAAAAAIPPKPAAPAAAIQPKPAAPLAAIQPKAAVPAAAAPRAIADPAIMGPVADQDRHPGRRPEGWVSARAGGRDNLQRIRGIGPQNESRLHALGIWHYAQIAAWTHENIQWVGSYLAFPGRIEREEWVAQAKVLAMGGLTPFAAKVDRGEIDKDRHDGAYLERSYADMKPSPGAAQILDNPAIAPRPAGPPEPAAMGPVEGEAAHAGKRPAGFVSPRGGKADDLKLIRGIGPQNEGRLHALGIWHFAQIAAWTHDNVLWVGSYLAFPGRIDREEWIAQAKVLASGGTTQFAARVERGEVPTSHDDGSHGQHNVAHLDKK